MKINFLLYICILLTTIFSSPLVAKESKVFSIVNPPQNHISEEGIVSVVVDVNNTEIDSLKIVTDINESSIIIDLNRSTYCQSIDLTLGESNITVSGYKGETLVKEYVAKVFVVSKVYKDYKYSPEEYKLTHFHNDIKEKVCVKCHDMSINEVEGVAFEDVKDSNCYTCHSLVASKQHAHAPAVNWLCTSCHNADVGAHNLFDKDKSKFIVPDPISSRCFSCHKKMKDKWDKKRFTHEPTDSGRCNKCHNPHSSDQPNHLRMPVWELCTSCHKDKIEGGHVVKTFSKKIHPTHGVKDPSNPGKDLSCISCHNPHVSDSPSLLESASVMGLCMKCHQK